MDHGPPHCRVRYSEPYPRVRWLLAAGEGQRTNLLQYGVSLAGIHPDRIWLAADLERSLAPA